MVEVKLRDGEKLDDALRRFKKEVEREGILRIAREKMYYKSPSVLKKEKMAQIKRRQELRKKRVNFKKVKQ
ncbi:MAG: 30S ribosomal protein S21 [Endomicrobia bacterium]|nr:30S ribosomal protein S21 [Endomicrobiia bacterium]